MTADRTVHPDGSWRATAQHSAMVALVRKGWELRPSKIANGWLQAIRHDTGEVVTGRTPLELLNKAAARDLERKKKAREAK